MQTGSIIRARNGYAVVLGCEGHRCAVAPIRLPGQRISPCRGDVEIGNRPRRGAIAMTASATIADERDLGIALDVVPDMGPVLAAARRAVEAVELERRATPMRRDARRP